MAHYEFLFRRDGVSDKKTVLTEKAGHDNRDAVEALLGVLAPDQRHYSVSPLTKARDNRPTQFLAASTSLLASGSYRFNTVWAAARC